LRPAHGSAILDPFPRLFDGVEGGTEAGGLASTTTAVAGLPAPGTAAALPPRRGGGFVVGMVETTPKVTPFVMHSKADTFNH